MNKRTTPHAQTLLRRWRAGYTVRGIRREWPRLSERDVVERLAAAGVTKFQLRGRDGR